MCVKAVFGKGSFPWCGLKIKVKRNRCVSMVDVDMVSVSLVYRTGRYIELIQLIETFFCMMCKMSTSWKSSYYNVHKKATISLKAPLMIAGYISCLESRDVIFLCAPVVTLGVASCFWLFDCVNLTLASTRGTDWKRTLICALGLCLLMRHCLATRGEAMTDE